MSFSRKTIILDCGASRTALGIFSQPGGRWRLDRQIVESLGATVALDEGWMERTAGALRRLRTGLGRGGPCGLVLPGHLVLTKFFNVPRATPEQRQKVIHFESEQNLPVALNELVWDSVISAEREAGLEVMLAAAHVRKVEALCAAARSVGFVPQWVLPGALALLAAVRAAPREPMQPSLLINLGARSTTFLFIEAGRFVARTFALGVLPNVAGEPAPDVASLVARLALEFTRSVLHFRRSGGLADPGQIDLVGGGAELPGLAEALSQRLQRPVAIWDPGRELNLVRAGAAESAGSVRIPPELLGAACEIAQDVRPSINLLPPTQFHQTARSRRRKSLVAAAVVLLALGSGAWWHFETSSKSRIPGAPVGVTPRWALAVTPPILPSESAGLAPPAVETNSEDHPRIFDDMELVAVKTEPYRLQLAGYFGGPDNYRAILVSPGKPETLVAESGQRFDALGVELRNLEVKKIPVTHADAWPVYEVAAFATLHDEETGEEVVLDSRSPKPGATEIWLRVPGADDEVRGLREGDDFSDAEATYVVNHVQTDPPEVVLARHAVGEAQPETRVLRPVPRSPANGGEGLPGARSGGLARGR